MAQLMTLEDFAPGMTIDCGRRVITEAELIGFAREFDSQPMHLDAEQAKKTLLGGLAASGWQTAAVAHRMVCDALLNKTACYGSPGVAELRWKKPVRPDIPLATTLTVSGVRRSRSRPEIGFVSIDETIEQSGETVCTHQSTLIIATADAGPVQALPAEPIAPPWKETVGIEALAAASLDTVSFQPVDLGCEVMTPEAIIDFAREYDPQPFHLSEAAGKASLFGGLAASGWHLTALWMRRLLESRREALAALAPEKRAAAAGFFGPSPGFYDLEWRRPALAGDVLRFFSQNIEAVPLKSRPNMAILRSLNGCVNEEGALVAKWVGQVFVHTG